MAGFRLQKPYTMPKEDVRQAAEGLAERLAREHGLRARWEGDKVSIKGPGVHGILSFEDGTIDVSVKMGLLVSGFQGALRKEVQRYLDEEIV